MNLAISSAIWMSNLKLIKVSKVIKVEDSYEGMLLGTYITLIFITFSESVSQILDLRSLDVIRDV